MWLVGLFGELDGEVDLVGPGDGGDPPDLDRRGTALQENEERGPEQRRGGWDQDGRVRGT